MIEDLLRETLRDPERALPAWPDPAGRVRRPARDTRRRRAVALAAAAAVVAGLVAVPRLLPDRRALSPAAPSPAPVAGPVPVADFPVAADEVVVGGGVVYVREGRRLLAVDPRDGRVLASGDVEARRGRPAAPVVRTALVNGDVWVAAGTWMDRYLGSSLTGVGGHGGQQPIDDLVTDGRQAWYAAGDRLYSLDGSTLRETDLPGRGPTRLGYADGVVWARRQGDDAALLVRVETAGRMRVAGTAVVRGGPRDAPLAAGGGRVYLAMASVGEDYLTGGAVVPVDASTLAVGSPVAAPFARDLAYADGSLWLLGIGGGLHRLDGRSLGPLGASVATGSARDIAVDGRTVWVAAERLLRFEAASPAAAGGHPYSARQTSAAIPAASSSNGRVPSSRTAPRDIRSYSPAWRRSWWSE